MLAADSYVDDIERGFQGLLGLLEDPSCASFAALKSSMERLEDAVAAKSFIDAAYAYICERDQAGREVGSPYASEYLKARLGLSAAEAYDRLGRGRQLFAPPPPQEPAGPGDPGDLGAGEQDGLDLDGGSGGGRGAQEKEAEHQAKARRNSQKLSAEKSRVIQRALYGLSSEAQCERAEILEKATEAAQIRTPEDLRKYVERLVANANRKHKPAQDPNAAWDERGVFFREEDASGKHRIIIDTTAGLAALFKSHVDAGLPANSNPTGQAGERDYRTPAQRRHDELVRILQQWESHRQSERGGAASVVLAMTVDDLATADHNTKFQTNTGIELTPAEIMRLGMCGGDYVLQLGKVDGLPLSLGRTRLADVHQKIALLAMQGVCAWEGCTRPMSELEIHHLLAYCQGGDTDLRNLIGLCRTHHRGNNDNRDGRDGRRHVDRDPGGSGEVGVMHPDGSMHFNETQGHTDCPGYKLRHRPGRPEHSSRAGHPPDLVLFPPPREEPAPT